MPTATGEEFEVVRPDIGRGGRSVTGKRGVAAEQQPVGQQFHAAAANVEHHLVVIAQKRHQPRLFAQGNEQFQHTARRPARDRHSRLA